MSEENKKNLQGNIWKYYLREFFAGMFFAVPIIILFLQENGLSLTEIMILQSIFSVIIVVLEIPTGYFADAYGRKKSLLVASFFLFLAITFYSTGHNFFSFLVAEIIFAFAISFNSGAASAFIYDTLVGLNQEQEYKKIWGNSLFISMIAVGASGIFGGFIGSYELRYAMYASIPFFLMATLITFSLYEPKKEKVIFKKGHGKELFKTIKSTFVYNKKLRWLILYSGVVYAFNQASFWLYQPYFQISGLDIIYFGFVFAAFQIIAAFSSKYSYKVEELLGKKLSLVMLIFLVSISYILMSNFVFLFSFSFAFLQQFVRGFRGVVVNDYINQLTNSNSRATILSSEALIGKSIYALIIPIIGWITDIYSLLEALLVLGITTLLIGIIMLLMIKKYKVI